MAVGLKHVLALDLDGKVYSWGRNDFGQVSAFNKKIYKI